MEKSRLANIAAALLSVSVVLALAFLFQSRPFPKTQTAYAGDNIWTWAGVSGTVTQIVTDPTNPSTVYALVGDSWQTTNRIMKSTDRGNTWANIADPSWSRINRIAMAYATPNVLYAATTSGTFRRNAGENTWQLVRSKPADAVAVSPVDWKEAYIAVGSTITKTVDGGLTWTTSSSGLPSSYPPFDDIAIAPSAPHTLIAKPFNMASGPLYKSTDGGDSWLPIGGSYLYAPNSVTVDSKNSNVIYLGTFSPGGWKSSDGGNNWQPLSNGLQQNGVGFVIDPDNTQVVHAANLTAGVLESLDGGASWTPINTGIQGLEVWSIGIASRQPLVIYAGLSNAGIWKMTRTAIQDFSITINNAAVFTNQTAVTLTLTAPPGTTEMQISNDGGFGGTTWEAFTTTKPWSITAYGSYVIPRTTYAKFKTNGQVSAVYQDDIILDQTPPVGTVQITGPITTTAASLPRAAGYSPVEASTTMTHTLYLPLLEKNYILGLRAVGLSLVATDDVSGVDAMLISNDAGFAGAQWQAYAQNLNWYVTENGTTTVYVKYRDRAANESQVYSAVTTAP